MPASEFPKLKPHPIHEAGRLRDPQASRAAAPDIPPYAELCVTSNYTFLTGASHPEEFVDRAAAMGYRAIAITDTNTLAGVVRAHVAAKEAGLPFVLGARLRLQDRPGGSVFVYPTDMASYRRLCRLLTIGKRRAPKGECRLMFDDLALHAEGLLGIVALEGDAEDDFERHLHRCREVFDDDRLSLAVRVGHDGDDAEGLRRSADLAARRRVPLVATNDAHHHHPDRRMLQDVLTCIRHGCTLAQAGFRLRANAERCLKPPEAMRRLFADHPGALARTIEIAERAGAFTLDDLRYEYPDEVAPAGRTPQQHLAELTWAGAERLYAGAIPPSVRAQLKHELALIEELNYAPYFLTVHDLVRYARTGEERPGEAPPAGWAPILCQGRGAAANSAVCYCLGVTAVDPSRIVLLFERFVSRERNEPPDIDIDFEHERREEVIQYIYRKYGRERAALTAEVITYRRRSAIRDVGKALGLSLDLVNRLAKHVEWFDAGVADAKRLRELGLNPDDRTLRWLLRLVGEVLGFPRHLSQHVGGFVITRSPLCELVPVENAAMPDRTVIEWDKDDLDAVGMLKVDVLGLGMLTALRRCLGFVNGRHEGTEARRHEGTEVQWHRMEGHHGADSNIQGFAGVAAQQGIGQGDLSSDGRHARDGTIRPDQPDAPRSHLDPFEHRGGLCATINGRLSPVPPERSGVSGGAVHPVRTGHGDGVGPGRSGNPGAPCGGGPHAPVAHHEDSAEGSGRAAAPRIEAGQQIPLRHDPPQSLGASVPLCLCASPPLSLHTIPAEDPATYEMIQRADTIGVFQIESRAQMSMLPRLKPACFYDLVIEVAIVRPGPIQGDMVHPYLRRRNGEEPVEYAHESIREVLEKTLGVPLFQEQCMALAVKAAGFTPGEADQLRRAMAAWKRKGDQIVRFGRKIISGMMAKGIAREYAERCFDQIRGFSEYGFPESHAASFALLVYASAWLKRHHPAEFTAALLNSQPMGFYAPAQIVRDAIEHGVSVRPIDVNHSGWDCSIERDGAVRLGLRLASGIGRIEAEKIRRSVAEGGPFRAIRPLWRCSGARAATIRRLAQADAFGSMGLARQQALWQARLLRDEPLPLFDHAEEAVDGRESLPPIMPLRQVVLDYSATGLSLKAHPVSFVRERLNSLGASPCSDLRDADRAPSDEWITIAGLVLVRQRPGTAEGVTFMTIEDETGIANLVVWRQIYERHRRALGSRLLLVSGRVQRQGEVVHVIVARARNLDAEVEGLATGSRDFR